MSQPEATEYDFLRLKPETHRFFHDQLSSGFISPLPLFHRRGLKVYPPSVCPSVRLSVRPSAISGSCDNLKTVWSLLMKLGKWIDEKVEIMHVLLFCSSTINFGCYVNQVFLFH